MASKRSGKSVSIRTGSLSCEECKRPWRDDAERWRVYLTDDEPAIVVAYCPHCARREFGEREAGGRS